MMVFRTENGFCSCANVGDDCQGLCVMFGRSVKNRMGKDPVNIDDVILFPFRLWDLARVLLDITADYDHNPTTTITAPAQRIFRRIPRHWS